ncbi:hypothetical protein PPTG_04552 [Plasmopara halstedii]|uniref:C2H2-type domain-containing protein n=1 Tax=Plasmopara halstedii TaxID=4781 RepID=A0A0P1ACZ1_PLAHL|nr:hypothetical protein PPTG_04552 [Plasmopara halstedii]CEG38247.1 hypothetical protein PPTG_04552 [Plasmopara halstedii]|eukprot:XP_024574616.1 hypothetical protein PPTG_04552 [Plasmopara halstedii]
MAASTAVRPSALISQPRFRDSHQDRPFACPVPLCGGRFHRKFTLHEHMKTHTGEQPHQCPIGSCGKRFSTSGNLARHKRLHSLHKMECPAPGCTRIFTSKDMLTKHQKVHNGNCVHTCVIDECGKTFSTAGNLTRHMKTQHRSVHVPATSRSSLQAKNRLKVVSPTDASHVPCEKLPLFFFDTMVLSPIEEHLHQYSFPNPTTALTDQELKDLLECLF